jgi:hypothetical protein
METPAQVGNGQETKNSPAWKRQALKHRLSFPESATSRLRKIMKKKTYNKSTPTWQVTNRTKQLETNYKGWDNPKINSLGPPPYKPRWVSRVENNLKEENEN